MATFKNLNGQGASVELSGDQAQLNMAIDNTMNMSGLLRITTAGNLVTRSTPSGADTTRPVSAGEYYPVTAGMIVRSTSTAAGVEFVRN